MPSRKPIGQECVAIKSPTSAFHAPRISLSCRRSRRPSFCITLGRRSAVDSTRSGRGGSEGRPRHSAMTARRRDGLIAGLLTIGDWQLLVLPSHVARQYVELGSILSDRPPRDRNAAFAQDLDDFLIAQGCAARFAFD